MNCHVCSYALEVNIFFQMQRQDARLPSARSMATHLVTRDVVVAARLRHINATLLISLPVPPVVIRTQRPQPERMAAGGGGGDARRKHSAFTVGAASLRRADTAKVCSSVSLVVCDGKTSLSAVQPNLQRRE